MIECPMCKLTVSQVCKSHFIPQHVYRRFRRMVEEGNKLNYIDSKFDTYVLPMELTRNLLCSKCELKLKVNGEDYFSEMCLPKTDKSDVSKLYKILYKKLIPVWNASGKLAPQISIGQGFSDGIDIDKLYYFAISMFWRGTFEWKQHYIPIRIQDELKEKIRLYLYDKDKHPLNFKVEVVPAFWSLRFGAIFPAEKKQDGQFFFSISSFDFHLDLSKAVKPFFYHSPITILASPSLDSKAYKVFIKKHNGSTERGKVKKELSWL